MLTLAIGHGQIEHLIEVTVIDSTLPSRCL